MSLLGRIEKRGNVLNIPGRGIVLWKRVPKLLKELGLLKDLKLSVDGAEIMQEIDGGLHVKVKPGTSTGTTGNFIVTVSSNGTGGRVITVSPGTFANQVPTLGGTALDASPAPTYTTTATGQLWVHLTISTTLSKNNDYVYAATLDSFVVGVGTSQPADTADTFHITLATVTGTTVSQMISSSLDGFVEDDGTATGKGKLIYFAA